MFPGSANRKQYRRKFRSRYFKKDRMVVVGREKQTVEYDDDGNVTAKHIGRPIKRKIVDTEGRPFTRKGARPIKGNSGRPQEPLIHTPEYDPSVSNHERVFRQRLHSGRYKRTTTKKES